MIWVEGGGGGRVSAVCKLSVKCSPVPSLRLVQCKSNIHVFCFHPLSIFTPEMLHYNLIFSSTSWVNISFCHLFHLSDQWRKSLCLHVHNLKTCSILFSLFFLVSIPCDIVAHVRETLKSSRFFNWDSSHHPTLFILHHYFTTFWE